MHFFEDGHINFDIIFFWITNRLRQIPYNLNHINEKKMRIPLFIRNPHFVSFENLFYNSHLFD